jgi:bifunctional UDP-N-acetylglucosamine pyrophosphorylase/glucosamine-1-phosphate N-acetyltransferase
LTASYVEAEEEELLGVNSRAELAEAEALVQRRLRIKTMAGGVTLVDPSSVTLNWDTKLGQDVTVGPNVVFGANVTVADDVEIRAFCHLEGVTIERGAQIGPFARLRPGAEIGENAHIGNFVEVKKASIEAGAKVNHLTYIGDARVGAGANVGAGTITCNYDGFGKYFTDIGQGAFIGSNSSLVAPVKIGDGAVVGAGSVVTKDVAPDALAVARGTQMELPGWAQRFRDKMKTLKKG